MAKRSITQAIGTTWRVHEDLAGSRGLAFIQDYLSGYDFSKLEYVTLHHGKDADGFHKAMPEDEDSDEEYHFYLQKGHHGLCRLVQDEVDEHNYIYYGEYRINGTIHTASYYPACDMRTAHTKFGKRKIPFYVNSVDESIIAIVAHEMAHYLGYTDQIPASGEIYSSYQHPTGWVSLTDSDGNPITLQSCDEIEAGEFMKAAVEAYRTTRFDEPPQPVTVTDTQDEHCLSCGITLATNRSKFCSDECRWTYHNRLRHDRGENDRQKVCEVCAAEFTAKRADAKTCSPRCRQRLRRASLRTR